MHLLLFRARTITHPEFPHQEPFKTLLNPFIKETNKKPDNIKYQRQTSYLPFNGFY